MLFASEWPEDIDSSLLGTERQRARMSKIKNRGLDQYGATPFEQQQFETAGIDEGVNTGRRYSRPMLLFLVLHYDTSLAYCRTALFLFFIAHLCFHFLSDAVIATSFTRRKFGISPHLDPAGALYFEMDIHIIQEHSHHQ